jgi:hypothetical protein
VAEENTKAQPVIKNEVSDETGQHDLRFMLWRQFCSEHDVPVESLPSQLDAAAKEKWDGFKELLLKRAQQ